MVDGAGGDVVRWIRAIADDPRASATLLIIAYSSIAITGLFGVALPHTLNSEARFYYPSFLGALLATLGGVLGAISVPRGVWWLERGSISLMAGAVVARIYSLGYQWFYAVMSYGEVAISISFLVCIIAGLLLRLLYIRGLALDPKV
jgi:hypothetical protein